VTADLRKPVPHAVQKISATSLEQLQAMWFTSFRQSTSSNVASGDKMMNKALGPVWHTKHKAPGIIPAGLHGLDQEAMWSKRHSDGWVYGHGSFCLVSHRPCVLGTFTYMRNSAHAAKRL
jgi:hypothetical protein